MKIKRFNEEFVYYNLDDVFYGKKGKELLELTKKILDANTLNDLENVDHMDDVIYGKNNNYLSELKNSVIHILLDINDSFVINELKKDLKYKKYFNDGINEELDLTQPEKKQRLGIIQKRLTEIELDKLKKEFEQEIYFLTDLNNNINQSLDSWRNPQDRRNLAKEIYEYCSDIVNRTNELKKLLNNEN